MSLATIIAISSVLRESSDGLNFVTRTILNDPETTDKSQIHNVLNQQKYYGFNFVSALDYIEVYLLFLAQTVISIFSIEKLQKLYSDIDN